MVRDDVGWRKMVRDDDYTSIKKGEPSLAPQRGITLLNTNAKIFTKMLYNRIINRSKEYNSLFETKMALGEEGVWIELSHCNQVIHLHLRFGSPRPLIL